MEQCVGIKKTGMRCTTLVLGGTRCGVHVATMNKVGPNQIRRDELKYVHNLNHETIRRSLILPGVAGPEFDRVIRERTALLREEALRYQIALNELETIIDRETEANGGLNADQPAIERRRAAQQARNDARLRWEQRNAFIAQRNALMQGVAQQGRQPVIQGELANLAQDRQNVHTALVVQKVKETVDKILRIPVPPEYQTETLKTSGEIILECNLSRAAAWQMMAKYCSDENIYEMGNGIYARVLNSVWQYIKASPDAVDLKKILASEMRDNIGMCAQGNLSRLCNILSGYLDGINPEVKSRSETIGERLAALMELPSDVERVRIAMTILAEFNIVGEEREAWLQPLIEA